jgi:transcriptional regulator with XRE-family HTH domain
MTTPAKPTLGSLLRNFRRERHWTLRELSARAGIPSSTLAKVEHDRLSLTYERLVQLEERVQLPIFQLLSPTGDSSRPHGPMGSARRSIGRLADATRTSTPGYDNYELCAELRLKRMLPTLTLVRAREIGELQRDHGEQFIYVLHGSVEVHTEFYAPALLTAGECIYIDVDMAYACIAAAGCDEASVLRVLAERGLC